MIVSMVCAASERGVIGRAGKLPWKIPSDMRRFKSLTMGHAYIVGRKTYDEVGKPLPGRRMIVVSRGALTLPESVIVVSSVDAALEEAAKIEREEVFIGGGSQIFAIALPKIDRIYLTRVHGIVHGDTRVDFLDGTIPDGFVEAQPPEELEEQGATHEATFHVYERTRHE